MNLYRQPIIVFGIIIPLLIGLVVVGIGYQVMSTMTASFSKKMDTFTAHKNSQMAVRQIENDVNRQRANLELWHKQLSAETASAVSSTIKSISEKLPGNEIQQTAFDSPNSTGGIGKVSAQKSSQIRLALRGTYRTVQRTFLELESRMPQLQLEELKIDPIRTTSSSVNVQVTYTAWEN